MRFKGIAPVALLAVAGLFGASAALVNKQVNETPVIEKASADVNDLIETTVNPYNSEIGTYKAIWLYIASDWYTSNVKTSETRCYSYDDTNFYTLGVDSDANTFSEFHGWAIFKIYLPTSATQIRLKCTKSSTDADEKSELFTITKKSFVIYTAYWGSDNTNQKAYWLPYYSDTEESFTTDWVKPMYFTIVSTWNSSGSLDTMSAWFDTYLFDKDGKNDHLYDMYRTFNSSMIREVRNIDYLELYIGMNNLSFLYQVSFDISFQESTGSNRTKNLTQNVEYHWSLTNAYYTLKTDGMIYSAFTNHTEPCFYVNTTNTGSTRQDGYWNTIGGSFLVGSGSFVNGDTTWSTSTGVNLTPTADNIGELLDQRLETGDIFKITNGNPNGWQGWTDKTDTSDTTNFTNTILDHPGDAVECYVEGQPSWWGSDSCVTRVIPSGSPISSHNEPIDLTGTSGTFEVYSDIKTLKFCRHNTSGNYNEIEASFPSEWNCSYNWYIFEQNSTLKISRTERTVGTNFYCKTSGVYDIYLNSSRKVHISADSTISDFTEDYSIYLDLTNATDWDGLVPEVYYWNTGDESKVGTENMSLVHNHGLVSTNGSSMVLYEWRIKKINGNNPNRVIFRYNGWSKQSQNVSCSSGKNLYVLSNNKGEYGDDYGKYLGDWASYYYVKDQDRAIFYGKYFNTQVVCDGGVTKPGNWDSVSSEYDKMSILAQGEVYKANAIPTEAGGNDLEQAMAKYDYIVFTKYPGQYTDFIGRNDSPGRNASYVIGGNYLSSLLMDGENSFTTIIIVVASALSLLSITALSILLVKKRKTKQPN